MQVTLAYPVDAPPKKRYVKTNTIKLVKSKSFIQGPLNLPSRRVDISGLPRYAYDEEHFGSFLGMLFLSDQDRKWRILQGRGSDALF